MIIKPWLTAISRKRTSLPLNKLLKEDYISHNDIILDFGCGHGFDLNFLKDSMYKVTGFDRYIKTFSEDNYKEYKYNKILCFYVLNVVDTEKERISIIENLLSLLKDKGEIFIAVRSEQELKSMKNKIFKLHNDGIVTQKHTFQKYFSTECLDKLISENFSNLNTTYITLNKNVLFLKISKL